jgi:hypothetical protein
MKTTIMTSVPGAIWVQPVEVDIEPGDRVLLKYDGFPHVPKWLGGSWAKVLEVNERTGTVKVQADIETTYPRTIKPGQHIRKLMKKEDIEV